MSGNRCDVDDGSLAARQSCGKAPCQRQGSKEIQLEHLPPGIDLPIQATEPLFERGFWRHRRIVDERVQRTLSDQLRRLFDECSHASRIIKISSNVMRPVRVPLALFRHLVATAGDNAPTFGAEAFYGGVSDAAAGAGKYEERAHSEIQKPESQKLAQFRYRILAFWFLTFWRSA